MLTRHTRRRPARARTDRLHALMQRAMRDTPIQRFRVEWRGVISPIVHYTSNVFRVILEQAATCVARWLLCTAAWPGPAALGQRDTVTPGRGARAGRRCRPGGRGTQ